MRAKSVAPQETASSLLFLSPFLLVFAVFLIFPIFYSLYLSFFDASQSFGLANLKFIGLKNYVNILGFTWDENGFKFNDPQFWWSLIVTFGYGLMSVPIGIFASLGLAILMNNRLFAKGFFRSAYFLPNVLDMLVVGVIWQLIYAPNYGILSQLTAQIALTMPVPAKITLKLILLLAAAALVLAFFFWPSISLINKIRDGQKLNRHIGHAFLSLLMAVLGIFVISHPSAFPRFVAEVYSRGGTVLMTEGLLANAWTALPAVVIAMVIKGAGFGMVLFLAALQNIPEAIYEAADIDGATAWQKFTKITMPMLAPIIFFMLTTGVIGVLNAFTEFYAMTSGGPQIVLGDETLGGTTVSGFYLYKQFEGGRYGYAAAISYVLLFITVGLTLITRRFLREEN